MATPTTWRDVQDLPADWEDLESPELATLRDVWQEQAQHLRDTKALKEFNARLAREWAIETGIIERLYTIDEGVSRLLIEQGLHASLIPQGTTDRDPEYVLALVQDQHQVVEWLFDFVESRRDLSTSFIKEMHQLMTRHQGTAIAEDTLGRKLSVELLRGAWRLQPTRIERLEGAAFTCCPPEQVSSAMDTLVTMSLAHRAMNVPAEIDAAWLHHRFAEIHPFQDGNGRVARALATLAFLRDGYFPLVVRRGDREEYLRALYDADGGDLRPLILLFVRLQKRSFVEALGISSQVLQEQAGLKDIVAAAADRLLEKAQEQERRMSEVFTYADQLFDSAKTRLTQAAQIVHPGISRVSRDYRAWSDAAPNNSKKDDYYHYQIVAAAKQLNYFANTRTYRGWIRLGILTDSQTDILVAIHCLGSEFRGVMVAVALTYRRERAGEDASTVVSDVDVLSPEPFLFNYNDVPAALLPRFGQWLDQVLTVGLDRWRRTL